MATPGTVVPVQSLMSPGGDQGPIGAPGNIGIEDAGTIKVWPSVTPPPSWMLCDGSAISRTMYSILFGVIGTNFGAGDGSTTFNLPDLRGRFVLGYGQGTSLTNRVLAAIGGEENHALSIAELAAHNHTATDSGHNHTQNAHNHSASDSGHAHAVMSNNVGYAGGSYSSNVACSNTSSYNVVTANASAQITVANATPTNNAASAVISVANTGSGTGHNTMPPFLCLTYIIKASASGGATAQAPLADTTQNGLLKKLSGVSTDYVGGDNNCHPLPSVIQVGGRLSYVSTTQLQFVPFNGSYICINGLYYQIPFAGIAGLANTSVYVNGVAGQNLAVSTLYRVYCFNNSGTLTADFSTTAHATSSTAGNIGTEIKSGDDTRTFIGLIFTNASSQFADAVNWRGVRSWVNRKPCGCGNNFYSASCAVGATGTWYGTGAYCYGLSFGDESMTMSQGGAVTNPTANGVFQTGVQLDGTNIGGASAIGPVAGYAVAGAYSFVPQALAEGWHSWQLIYLAYNTGTFTISMGWSGVIA